MARLIGADRLIEALPIVTEDKQISLYGAVADFMVMISEMPTIDAVEVVRCRDCIHWDSETGWCNNHSASDDHDMDWNIYNDDDFCSYGERRNDG